MEFVHAGASGNLGSDLGIVTGQHNDMLNTSSFQCFDHLHGIFAQSISDAEQAKECLRLYFINKHRGLTFALHITGFVQDFGRDNHIAFDEHTLVADP